MMFELSIPHLEKGREAIGGTAGRPHQAPSSHRIDLVCQKDKAPVTDFVAWGLEMLQAGLRVEMQALSAGYLHVGQQLETMNSLSSPLKTDQGKVLPDWCCGPKCFER